MDPITLADEAEERSAADALRAAETTDDLVEAWCVNCDHYPDGSAARERLNDVYATRFRELVPYVRAG
jgi:hypothetical protein